jgi:hypothetical protein
MSSDTHETKHAEWRSWLDKSAIPAGWDRNLWDEFYALLHRRAMWRGYRQMLQGSSEGAQETARFLTQWVLRNHIETQTVAIRRIANRIRDRRPVSFVRILDEIAAQPQILNIDARRERRPRLTRMPSMAERRRFPLSLTRW